MSKVSNAILMLKYLENGKKYSIKELSEKLEVSERMVRFYKEELEKAGIYIDTIMGPYGGYVLTQSVKVPLVKLSHDDYEFLKNIKVSDEDAKRFLNILDKMKCLSKEVGDVSELKDDIRKNYNILAKAIKEKRKVKINYYSFTNGNQDRIIRPYDMFLYNTGWGVAAFCELRNDLRNFELKRINNIELLDEKF